MSKECTLSDKELIERSQEWVSKLAKSGGKAWILQVPVNFNRDPDMLFIELCKRLEAAIERAKAIAGDAWDAALQKMKHNGHIGTNDKNEYLSTTFPNQLK
jgi:hypothetical protein